MNSRHHKLNILLVNPTYKFYTHAWPPLGLACLGAALEAAGHSVRIVDPTNLSPDAIFVTPAFVPDLVGISTTSPLRLATLGLCAEIKSQIDVPIVVGGPDVTASPETYIDVEAVDYAVSGEGETTLVELAAVLSEGGDVGRIAGLHYRKDGVVTANEPRTLEDDLDRFPMPARHLLDMAWYGNQTIIRGSGFKLRSTTVMTSRGCPWNCLFCDSRRTWTRRYRTHSTERVIEELSRIRADYGISAFQFLDDTFPVNPGRTIELCGAMERALPGISWACQARADKSLTEDLIEAMKVAGCLQLEFGVESGAPGVLKMLRKGFDVDQLLRVFALCRKHRMRTYANLIIGTPGETEEDVRRTFALYDELRPNAADMWVVTPYPGSDLYEYCRENDLLADTFLVDRLHHGHELGDVYMIKSLLSQSDVDRLRNEFYSSIRRSWNFD